jgi:hypothetical protein
VLEILVFVTGRDDGCGLTKVKSSEMIWLRALASRNFSASIHLCSNASRLFSTSSREGGCCVTFEFGQTTFDMDNSPGQFEAYLKDAGYELRNVVDGDPGFPARSCRVHSGRSDPRTFCLPEAS